MRTRRWRHASASAGPAWACLTLSGPQLMCMPQRPRAQVSALRTKSLLANNLSISLACRSVKGSLGPAAQAAEDEGIPPCRTGYIGSAGDTAFVIYQASPASALFTSARVPSFCVVLARHADDQRDVAVGALLIAGVASVSRYHLRPQFGLLLRRRLTGQHWPALARHGQLDLGLGDQVAAPVRVTVVSSLGGHQHDLVAVDDRRREDGRTRLPRLAAHGVQLDDGHPVGRAKQSAAAHGNDHPVRPADGLEADVGQRLLQCHAATLLLLARLGPYRASGDECAAADARAASIRSMCLGLLGELRIGDRPAADGLAEHVPIEIWG